LKFFILYFEISLPPIPASLKIKVEIFYFGFWNLTTANTRVWKYKLKFFILILDFQISLFIFFMNLTTLELDTIYFYFIKLGHFIPTAWPQGRFKDYRIFKNLPPTKFYFWKFREIRKIFVCFSFTIVHKENIFAMKMDNGRKAP